MNINLNQICKHFGKLQANDHISLLIPGGTIQGILGENGAGKSTLMKILSGFIQADEGEVILDGVQVRIHSPADAIQHGVGMLHQDPLDFPPMRVIDNFVLGQSGGLFPDWKSVVDEFKQLSEQFDFKLRHDAYVDMLTVGERQQLEILRLLWLGAQVIILDEPTTGISALQKQKLFETLKILAGRGKTVIFVSHKLEDVENLCDRVVVLRQGKLVGEQLKPFNTKNLVNMMFGKSIALEESKSHSTDRIAFELRDLSLEEERIQIQNIDLKIQAGEVIGLAGMEGSGQRPFMQACAGFLRPVHGRILVNGRDMTGMNYPAFKRQGVGYMPASRLEEGMIPGLTLSEHFILAGQQEGLFIDHDQWQEVTREKIRDYNIRGKPESPVESLSGGNQQRALLALLQQPLKLVLLEHPTRGLDIESVIYTWGKLKERCCDGAAIIYTSSDLEEILLYSDRILVFFSGKVSAPLSARGTSVAQLGNLIGGKDWARIKTGVGVTA
ncbi:MAG: ATP-binding cassette domain-containing protein [Anaerolineaceae bacterium]|nr:ATP-binding cassette domain-containing protein [Anaerolineaceae bacterium]MBN2678305.1 ATP-binding cassette domain-containing protein [Anaerolineaceae bacterium]